jgi:hypothetical protein
MAQFVLVMTHPPDQCPTANATIRKLVINQSSELPRLAKQHGVKFVAGPLVSNEHRGFAIIEADKIEGVNEFVTMSGLIQWNSVEVIPTQTMAEGMKQIEALKPIY